MNIIVGSHIWVENPKIAWNDSEVTEINGRDATIIAFNGKTISFSHLIIICTIGPDTSIIRNFIKLCFLWLHLIIIINRLNL